MNRGLCFGRLFVSAVYMIEISWESLVHVMILAKR